MTTPTRPQVTEDERLLLAMLAAGWTHERIARHLHLGRTAVGMRLARVYRAIGAVNGPNAVAIAIRDGLINANQRADQQ